VSKGCNSNILETVWCVTLKLIRHVLEYVKVIERKYLHPNATDSTHATTTVTTISTFTSNTATLAMATTINSTNTTAGKMKGIKANNFGNIETVWKLKRPMITQDV